ncbi:hypothetical protein [Rhizobium leguminosarum]|uniref:hypothetical protein n=1 Tax=Rhizobium leguminosarum TaxID=384 RepID=UPI001AE97E68|nr:hypothetical protein [Rhizobium leguminosarum]MBP2444792.1 hypothetical protein [Rhizobium leguminosarum]
MPAALADIPTWEEIKTDLKCELADRFGDMVGSGVKTAGARRFFGWLASSDNEHAIWMKEFVTDGNRDVTADFGESGQPFQQVADRHFAKSRTAGSIEFRLPSCC